MQIMKITNDIFYVGVNDRQVDLFEGQYIVPNGISYNSYVILDEKIAVMDTVDARKGEEWKANLTAVLDGRQPDYLVVHHMEPDHASLIAEAVNTYPAMKVVLSAAAAKMLPNFFEGTDFEGRVLSVKEGDSLSLGTHILQFIAAPMVHWPEVIMSYEQTEKVLFAADGFGKFGALCNETDDWACEARRYYFNICGKYGAQVQAVLQKAATLDIRTICPLHGPVLSGDLTPYLSLYDIWSRYQPESEGVLVAYASIHGGTAAAAREFAEMLRARGAEKVVLSDLSRSDMAEVIEDAFRYPRWVLAASSYDAGVFPVMHDFLHHLQIKKDQKRRIGLIENGSWAPCAARAMRTLIEPMKEITLVEPTVTIRSRMKQTDIPAMEALADAILA